MKTVLFSALFFFCTFAGFARQTKSDDWKQQGRHQVGVSWGFGPAGAVEYNFGGKKVYFNGYVKESNKGSGNVYYLYRVSKVISAGVAYGYTQEKGYTNSIWGDIPMTYRADHHTILPQVQVNWLNRKWVTLYSRVGVGVHFQRGKYSYDNGTTSPDKETTVALQLSPFGFEIGRRLAGFGEIGLGHLGVYTLGVRYRF